jgi:hypothetical protein
MYATIQETWITLKSTFEYPVHIKSIESSDQRIMPRVITKTLNSNTTVEAI